MNRAMKFSSAAMGMAFLAGLAYYQGGADPTLGEEDALIGTALVEPTDIDVTKELAVDVMNDGDCESTSGLDDPTADECTEKERSSGTE